MTTRTDRRRFGAALALASAPLFGGVAAAQQDEEPAPATEAAAETPAAPRWTWVEDWPKLDEGDQLGNTHGCLCVDSAGNLLANTDTDRAVVRFAPDGRLLGSWGAEYRGGLHGMTLRREGDQEFLYLVHTMRSEVLKTTLDGEVLWTIGWPEESGIYEKQQDFRPTAVAVTADGRIYVADGYGKSWIHLFDRERRYVRSFGGPGSKNGQFKTPHGLWIDARSGEELLLVCDRENARLQWFDLNGKPVREAREGMLRPCNVWPLEDGMLAVADLAGRVAILDRDDQPIAFLGDTAPLELRAKNGVDREHWQKDRFFAPHSVCADRDGNLYVMDWNRNGRITKLRRER